MHTPRSLIVRSAGLLVFSNPIGCFVIKAMVTEGMRPDVVGASHMGRWRRKDDRGTDRWSSALVDMAEEDDRVSFRQIHGVEPWESADPSSARVWWNDAGVHQNITFPVHPDPISGMHCWHQKVRVQPVQPGDRYADIYVDGHRAAEVAHKWGSLTRPATGELRRPIWLFRPVKPVLDAYALPQDERARTARSRASEHPNASEVATLVDWNPEKVWGPLEVGTVDSGLAGRSPRGR